MDRKFLIREPNKEKVHSALLRLSKRIHSMMGKHDPHRAWLQSRTIKEMTSLVDVLELWECHARENASGDVISIVPDTLKMYDLNLLFTNIAPFIEPDSSIALVIEEQDTEFIWNFDGKTVNMKKVQPCFQRTKYTSERVVHEFSNVMAGA